MSRKKKALEKKGHLLYNNIIRVKIAACAVLVVYRIDFHESAANFWGSICYTIVATGYKSIFRNFNDGSASEGGFHIVVHMDSKTQEDEKMAVVDELIKEENGTLSFGNFELAEKTKLDGFEFQGDKYKIKTFKEITKLEKNGSFVYESVPGTVVHGFHADDKLVEFEVEGTEDSQITLELEAGQEYVTVIDGNSAGSVKTNLGGKLNFSVELNPGQVSQIKIEKI